GSGHPRVKIELAAELVDQHVGNLGQRGGTAQVYHLSNLEPGVTTRVDAAERLQVHGHVEGQSVKRAAAPHAQAQRADLGAVDVHAGSAIDASGLDVPVCQGVDDGLFDASHQFAYAHAQTAQVDQRIGHDLPRSVVRHLPTALDPDHRDVARRQYLLGLARLTQGEHRVVF